jgi:hypothetical protein
MLESKRRAAKNPARGGKSDIDLLRERLAAVYSKSNYCDKS